MLTCSIGVMAYNEEANIGYLLECLYAQRLVSCEIKDICVVASGCTDRTEEIVRSCARRNPQVRLLVQEKREGKASAINLFLRHAEGDIVILESGDTLPEPDTVENLVQPFQDPMVGMTGGRPVPMNATNTFIGFTVGLYWRLHHQIALSEPKLGEMVAFRNIIHGISADTAVDEASIEALINKAGLRIHYAGNAVVHNKGAETIRDYIKQRRRVTAGHKHLQATCGYTVSTIKVHNLVRLVGRVLRDAGWSGRFLSWTAGAMALELYGKLLGDYDYYVKKKNPFVWDIAKSTKNLRNDSSDS